MAIVPKGRGDLQDSQVFEEREIGVDGRVEMVTKVTTLCKIYARRF